MEFFSAGAEKVYALLPCSGRLCPVGVPVELRVALKRFFEDFHVAGSLGEGRFRWS